MSRKLTDVLSYTNLKIAFIAIIPPTTFYTPDLIVPTQLYSGIYQLKCHTGDLFCLGNTGKILVLRNKEYIHYITSSNPQSAYVLHILHNSH